MRRYSRNDILDMLTEKNVDARDLYKHPCINYAGETIEGELYNELVAGYFLENPSILDSIATITRAKSYFTPSHNGNIDDTSSNREEELIAKGLFNKTFPILGTILDYQVPLKNSRADKGLGKVDLISYNKDSNILYLLELKKPAGSSSEESMLRCVLEGYTYLKIIDKEKLKKDFKVPGDATVKTAPLVFSGSRQDLEYQDPSRTNLHALMDLLTIKPFIISFAADGYSVACESDSTHLKVHVLRGSDQIGGSIIEVTTDKTKLILDLGSELDEGITPIPPRIDGLFENETPKYNAVLISHYHRDHTGLLNQVNKEIPIYMANRMYQIHKFTTEHSGDSLAFTPTIYNAEDESLNGTLYFEIGDIKVTPFLCDHSAFESVMYLLESKQETVLYTGDFRSNGRKRFSALLNRLPSKVNKLIIEGTNINRDYSNKTECEVEKEMAELMDCSAPIFFLGSSTNLDRIVSLYKASRKNHRLLLVDAYLGTLLKLAGGHMPSPVTHLGMNAFLIGNTDKDYTLFNEFPKKKRHGRKDIIKMDGSKVTMAIRASRPMKIYLTKLSEEMDLSGSILIYSMWSGYQKQKNMKEFLNYCESLGMKIVNVHTSGHADKDTIIKLTKHVNPDEIIPVHTDDPIKLLSVLGGDY
ncbi:Cft2 family RNA processing exonuclease [Lachnospiraceae bacterium PF1-21]|uniref:MBL fold metallo-hydrolase RNA specificity domain-containing protein n=1 Tax=Ohessyouella blattaphilus TaxID=2949333 RepID=UPI003E2D19E0